MSEHPQVQHAVHLRKRQHREHMGAGLIGAVKRADDDALTGLSRVFGWPLTVWLFFAIPLIARFLGSAFQSQFFYYSSGWLQLFALPLLTYIGVKLQRSSDAQSDVIHQALSHIATVSDQNKTLIEQDNELTAQVHALVMALSEQPAPQQAVQMSSAITLDETQIRQLVEAIQANAAAPAKTPAKRLATATERGKATGK